MKRTPMLTVIVTAGLLTACAVAVRADDATKRKNRAETHLIEARRLASDYQIDKAADKARGALKDDPNMAEAHVYLGMERLRASDLKAAESELNQALELDPYLAQAHCWLGYVLYRQDQLESATDHWNLAARLDPTAPNALAGVALSQFKHGQEDEAVRTYKKVLLYDRRFTDGKFLESDKGPKWSGQVLQDFEALLRKISQSN